MPDDYGSDSSTIDAAIDAGLEGHLPGEDAGESRSAPETPAKEPSRFERILSERGLSEEDAERLLDDRRADADLDAEEERRAAVTAEAEQLFSRQFATKFREGLDQYIQDPQFRRLMADRLRRADPSLFAAGQQLVDDIDPQTAQLQAMRREIQATNEANERRVGELERRLSAGAESALQERQYEEAVARDFEGWMASTPQAGDYYEELLAEASQVLKDQKAKQRAPFGSGLEVKRFLNQRLSHYRGLRQKYGGAQRTKPPMGLAGTPSGKARTTETTDLSTRGIVADILSDIQQAGGS